MYLWTHEEIEKILIQLDDKGMPFSQYAFCRKEKGLCLLGKGGYALVYEAENKSEQQADYAIKVIGFGDKRIEKQAFEQSVETQMRLSANHGNIVKVHDYAQIQVYLDEKNQISKVESLKEKTISQNVLRLQFVVIEKLEPVLSRNKHGELQLYPLGLKNGEWEILCMTMHIASALAYAHECGVLHRDVKLENVFFSNTTRQYKLGDFGIARVTNDGLASTIAYTLGYGAPEIVKNMEEKYSNTADIYSLGMMLFVLLNDLKFPGADGYFVNRSVQYAEGYLLPLSVKNSSRLWNIAHKMCRYEPENRYQSVKDVLMELEKILFDEDIYYKRQHSGAVFVLATIFLVVGIALVWGQGLPILQSLENVTWVIVTLFSLAYVLYTHGLILKKGSLKLIYQWYQRNRYWRMVKLLYFLCIVLGFLLTHASITQLARFLGEKPVYWMLRAEIMKVGIFGLLFCVYFQVREWLLKQRDLKQRTWRSELESWRQIRKYGILPNIIKIKVLEFIVRHLKK